MHITKRLALALLMLLLLVWQALPTSTTLINRALDYSKYFNWYDVPSMFGLYGYTVYARWNLSKLNKLADTIMAQDSIKSMHLQPDNYSVFFLNEDSVEENKKYATSSEVFIDDYLKEHSIPKSLYADLRQQMKALSIMIFYKNTKKQTIEFIRPEQYPVHERIAYSPKYFFDYPGPVHLIAPNWYIVLFQSGRD